MKLRYESSLPLLAAFALLAADPSHARPLFDTPSYAFDVIRPDDLAAVDLDADGDLDLVVSRNVERELLPLYNQGDGSFTPGVTQLIFGGSEGMAIADMDEDGRADIVVRGPHQYVNIFLNTGTVPMPRPWFELYSEPGGGMAVGDVNGDNHLDVMGIGNGGTPPTVRLALGDGDGNLLPQTAITVDASVRGTDGTLADLDRDGKLDLVISGHGPVFQLRGNGNGTFQNATEIAVGGLFSSIGLGDLNGDGELDLAVFVSTTPSIVLGVGSAAANVTATANEFVASTGPVAVADVDADGDRDLLFSYPGATRVYLNDGNGAFDAGTVYTAGSGGSQVVLLDAYGAGRLDVALPLGAANRIVLLRNRGGGSYASGATSYPMGSEPNSVQIMDLNHDGERDLIVANPYDGQLSLRLGTGGVTFGALQQIFIAGDPFGLTAGDVNNDGDLDLVTANPGNPRLRTLLGNGDGTFVALLPQATGQKPQDVELADFNFDGLLDAAFADPGFVGSTAFFVVVRPGNGDGTFGAQQFLPTPARSLDVAIGDLNADGLADIVAVCSPPDRIAVFLGHGNGTFGVPFEVATGVAASKLVLADVNGDGDTDVVVTAGGNLMQHLGAGDGSLGSPTSVPANGNAVDLDAGDLDRDGDIDLVSGHADKRVVGVVEGGATFTASPYIPFGAATSLKLARVNADGLLDLVVTDRLADRVWVYPNVLPGAPVAVLEFPSQPGSQWFGIRERRNGEVMIEYALTRAEAVQVSVFDVRGRRLWSVARPQGLLGVQSMIWDRTAANGGHVARGVYFVELATPTTRIARKLPLLRP